MVAAPRGLPRSVPDAVTVPDAPRRLSRRRARLPVAGVSPRSLLRRLLLGSHGAVVRYRRDERALDRAPVRARPAREVDSVRTVGCARGRSRLCGLGRLDVAIPAAVIAAFGHVDHHPGIATPEFRLWVCRQIVW